MLNKEVLKNARTKKGLTQEALAELVGLSQNHLSQVEQGKKEVSLKALKLIAEALDVKVDDLLNPPTPSTQKGQESGA